MGLFHLAYDWAPRFGVLKLGTGNSVATLMKSSSARNGGILDDVLRARASEVPGVIKLELLHCEGKRAPFVGVGLDAGVLVELSGDVADHVADEVEFHADAEVADDLPLIRLLADRRRRPRRATPCGDLWPRRAGPDRSGDGRRRHVHAGYRRRRHDRLR